MISQDQANKLIKTKAHLYKAFVRNGTFLPTNRDNAFISKKMLQEMYTGKCHCPKYADMKFLPCSDPPSASFLRDELAKLIEENGGFDNEEQAKQWKRLAKHIQRNVPERQWTLGMLATIVPGHDVFKKDYRPPKRPSQ